MCIKSDFKEILLKLLRNGQSDKAFLSTSNFVPKGLSDHALGLYACIKSLKMCIKSDFKRDFFKLSTNGQIDKAFLLTSKFCPHGVVYSCPGAIYIYKIIKMCIKSDFKEILVANDRSDRMFLLTSKFCPLPWSYIHLLNHEKVCIKSDVKVMRPSCWHKNFGPKGLSGPAQMLHI